CVRSVPFMPRMSLAILAVIGASAVGAIAQVGPTFVNAEPYPFFPYVPAGIVAPGSIITLFVRGMGSSINARVKAQSSPLPTVLAGISVTMTQTVRPDPGPLPVPLLEVFPVDPCNNSQRPCGRLLGIAIQVPLEFVKPSSSSPIATGNNGASL